MPRMVRRLLIAGLWLVTLALAFLAGAYAHRDRARIRALLRSVQDAPTITTNLYSVRVRMVAVPAEGRDGGLARLGDGVLFANRLGQLWFLDSELNLQPLTERIPINFDEFEQDPYNTNITYAERFAIKDILVQTIPGGVRLLASHNHWYSDRDCNTLRVSALETTTAALLGDGEASGEWRTVFETSPCKMLGGDENSRHPSIGAGGRLAALSETQVLLSTGGLGNEIEPVGPAAGDSAAAVETSYGKTILIDLASGDSRIYTRGHRNPQGLAVGPDGRVWLTEHAARGGDELNLLRDGADYGYPHVSYGTQYGMMTWEGNPRQGHHDGFEKPIYAWVPSIGISQLEVLEGRAFTHWAGDLLVSSLGGESLYRVRVEEGRVIFAEPIMMDDRIRDLVEAPDGSIILKTDHTNFLIVLTPADASSEDLEPEERGALLAAQCQGCHSLERDGASRIGPPLWGIVGNPIAAREDFTYSASLAQMDGRWTEEALRSFLAAPDSFAPGTAMTLPAPLDDRQTADIVAYLRTLE